MSEKLAEIGFELHELLRRRWSPRAFAGRAVEREKIGSLVEAVRWAASSRNEQPWRLVVVERSEGEGFERMVGCLSEGNKPWAGKAPVLILVCAAQHFAADGSVNQHAGWDCGFAVGCMTVQAMALDLWVHQMAGFSVEKAREAFGVPAGFEPVTVVAVGYYGDPAELPEGRRVQEAAARSRKAVEEIAFRGKWGNAIW